MNEEELRTENDELRERCNNIDELQITIDTLKKLVLSLDPRDIARDQIKETLNYMIKRKKTIKKEIENGTT